MAPERTETQGTAGLPGAVAPRLAYQLVLHARASLVDLREDSRDDAVPSALLSSVDEALSAGRRIIVIGESDLAESLLGGGIERLDGGLLGWRAAGLPVA